MSGTVPENLAGVFVEGEDLPNVARGVGDGIGIAVEAGPESLAGIAGDGGHQVDVVSPDDRRRHGEAGDRSLPGDAGASLSVPGDRRIGAVSEPAGAGSPELGPVAGSHAESRQGEQEDDSRHCAAPVFW